MAAPDGVTEPDWRALCDQLSRENQLLRARVVEVLALAEDAVAARVSTERELEVLNNTKTMRIVRPLRAFYGRARTILARR